MFVFQKLAKCWPRSFIILHTPQQRMGIPVAPHLLQQLAWLGFYSYFIYLFIFISGCVGSSVRARAFSGYGKWGPLFIAVRGPFTIAAPPAAGHRLQTRRLSSCGSRAQLLRGMWDPPRPGLEPVSPILAGRFSTTASPGKPG